MSTNQLNKLQIKAEVMMVISKLQTMPDISTIDGITNILSQQEDKKAILDILIKELIKTSEQKAVIICYLLVKLCEKNDLETALWQVLQTPNVNDIVKSIVLNLLKDMGNKVDYENLHQYFNNPDEIIDADTQKLLHVAIINPEAQIDFLDFLNSLSERDKDILVNSLGEDYSSDELANILIPVFLYTPTSNIGTSALNILGETKSQLALHALNEALNFVIEEDTISLIKKNLSKLKIAGVREDNAIDFYKNILSESQPYECYTSYPDGHGNLALIFSRENDNGYIQFFASVINDSWGILDCFGFNEITKEEMQRIVERFYSGDEKVKINPSVLKTILQNAENKTRKTDGEISYEYICWKRLLSDIPNEPVPVEFILNSKFQKEKLTDSDMEKIYMADFIQRWFMDTDYNPEFKQLIEEINKKISDDNFKIDFDTLVKENTPLIFSDEERNMLDKRILMSAYLKYLSDNIEDSRLLFSLYYDEANKAKLSENIVRKSIYEYYVALKFKQKNESKTTNIFALKNKPKTKELSMKQLELMISIIENLWVKE